jgi:3'-phosphoadenosine 5'-phosphosulfate sulfotransferase (PAPS reductase)/FAD synthetase
LGKTYSYIQWDEGRNWIRKKPDIAICVPGKVFDQYTMDEYCARPFKGKVAFLTGVRADESLVRFRSCVNKKNENYINATSAPNVKLCKPIYDWSEKDIFRYFYDKNIRYCETYDKQMWNAQPLRVATPLHAESAKTFDKVRTLYPVFYEQIIDIFPEMLVQERYWKDYDRYGVIYRYPRGWKGVLDYIKDEITDKAQRKLATKRVVEAAKIRKSHLAAGRYTENFGGYPIMYVFKTILAGSFKRPIQPTKNPTKEEIAYEEAADHI